MSGGFVTESPHGLTSDLTELALEASRAGTWRWNMADGTVTWDTRLEALHGLEPGTFQGTFEHWVELLHPDEVEQILHSVRAALDAPGEYDLLHRTTWADGSIHWVECRGRVTTDATGAPTGTIGVAFDVTERKAAEEELRVQREESTSIARRLQESLLGPPVLLPGAGHAARYVPAAHGLNVGGDWYNAQRLPDGRLAVAVGDVVGNGLESATVMGQLRSALSAAALAAPDAATAVRTLDAFAQSVPGAACATAVLAFIDIENGSVEFSRAGHLPPVLVSPAGRTEVLEGAGGPPLAAVAGVSRSNYVASFPEGSLLILYSDGLVERRGEVLDTGIDRLLESVQRHWDLPLEMLCDRLLDEMFDDSTQSDDVALVVARTPATSSRIFLRKVPSRVGELRAVRSALGDWLSAVGVTNGRAEAFQTAVGEACANAIEHANPNGNGLFRIEATRRPNTLIACVTDTGTWRPERNEPLRGYGLQVVRALMDDVEIVRRNSGTSVIMQVALER
jgi:PAS domain S-box-containing protein